jgi:hypothetical protein
LDGRAIPFVVSVTVPRGLNGEKVEVPFQRGDKIVAYIKSQRKQFGHVNVIAEEVEKLLL